MLQQSKQHSPIEFSIIPGGFAIAVIVWLTAFITRFPGIPLSGKFTFILLISVMFVSALLLAIFGPSDPTPAAKIKRTALSLSITGLINILLVGSVISASSLTTPTSQTVDRVTLSALLWIPGSFIATVILGLIAAVIANLFTHNKNSPTPTFPTTTSPSTSSTPRQAALTLIIILTTLCLILVGGVVTSADAGMSVPDWPTSYGWNMFLFPFTKMVGGIYYEHAHRLIGSLVGLETLILFIWLWRSPPLKHNTSLSTTNTTINRRFSWWGSIAFLLVCLQGALGGVRVFQNDTRIAVVHALTALIFLAIITGILWHLTHIRNSPTTQTPTTTQPRLLRILPIFLIIAILLQTLAGAIYRHFQIQSAFHFHLLGAGIILIIVVTLLANIMMGNTTRARNAGPIIRTVFTIFIITVCQIALGMASWVVTARFDQIDQTTSNPIIFTTAGHVLCGAILLAASIWLSLHTLYFLPETLATSENQPNNTQA